jgi:ribosomal-protein-alanine N-acetyltransferase
MHTVRAADIADYPVFARLFPELAVADPVPSREQFAAQMLPHVMIVEENAVPAGYAFWRCYGAVGHVGHVVVAPEARGHGLGGALVEEVRLRMTASGCTRWYLNVKQDNAPALRVYERAGMTVEREGWSLDTTWAKLDGLPKGDRVAALAPMIVPERDDATLAQHFGLDPGRLTALRQKPGEVMCAVYDQGVPVGLGAFDPTFPGVYPVCVVRTDVAYTLFQALRPHARHDHVHVTVEGDRTLYEVMCSAGAQLRHAFFRMGAAL